MAIRRLLVCSLPCLLLVGCADNGPSVTSGTVTNSTFQTFPNDDSNDDNNDDDDDDGDDTGVTGGPGATGETTDSPTGAASVTETGPEPTTEPTDDSTSTDPTNTSEPSETSNVSNTTEPPPPDCGNGVPEVDEACDDGNGSNSDDCLNDCTLADCGDGFVQAGVEGCDDGNGNNNDGCSNSCVSAACGDGEVQAGEECDDGNGSNTDACLGACVAAACGDGFVRAGVEACDDGNGQNGDGCDNDCTKSQVGKYTAVGPQVNIAESKLVGWTECFSGAYGVDDDLLDSVFATCNKANLMLACRPTGTTTYSLLAHAPRTEVLKDVGDDPAAMHVANGSAWYFSSGISLGFAKSGDIVNRNTCDVEVSNPGQRLCWHTEGGAISSGWRCGAATGLFDTSYERVILHAN